MSIEVMKQALDALEIEDLVWRHEKGTTPEYIAKAITSLRQAIAEAEKQEPVAWQDTRKTWVDVPLKNVLNENREPLTDELLEVLKQILDYHTTSKPWNAKDGDMSVWIKSARAVIAKATGEKV